jgi:hypothetical protein
VNMFKSFHVDSPCRTRTSLCACSCCTPLLLMRLLDVDDDDDLRCWMGVTKPVAVYVLRRASSSTTRKELDDVMRWEVMKFKMTSTPLRNLEALDTASRRNSYLASPIIPHLLLLSSSSSGTAISSHYLKPDLTRLNPPTWQSSTTRLRCSYLY